MFCTSHQYLTGIFSIYPNKSFGKSSVLISKSIDYFIMLLNRYSQTRTRYRVCVNCHRSKVLLYQESPMKRPQNQGLLQAQPLHASAWSQRYPHNQQGVHSPTPTRFFLFDAGDFSCTRTYTRQSRILQVPNQLNMQTKNKHNKLYLLCLFRKAFHTKETKPLIYTKYRRHQGRIGTSTYMQLAVTVSKFNQNYAKEGILLYFGATTIFRSHDFRLTPSFFILESRVVGLSPRISAAPWLPRTRHPVLSITARI